MLGHSYRSDAVHLDLSPLYAEHGLMRSTTVPRVGRYRYATFFAFLRMRPNLKVAMMDGGVLVRQLPWLVRITVGE
jgi:hypothetical protein